VDCMRNCTVLILVPLLVLYIKFYVYFSYITISPLSISFMCALLKEPRIVTVKEECVKRIRNVANP